MELTQNPSVLELVRKTAELTTPKEIVWIDGSEAQLESLRKIAVETGELIKLNEEKLPGCYLNRSDVNDVARVEGRTFICSRTREEAGPTNNWMDPDEMKAKLGFPRFKSKHHTKNSYTTNVVNGNILLEGNRIRLPKLKWISMKKHREPAENCRLKSVTVSMEPSGKYFASLLYEGYSCENQAADKDYSNAKILGIDYAMQGMAVFSEEIEHEKAGFFRKNEKRLAREQRKLSRCVKGSHNYVRQKKKVARCHEKIRSQRRDYLHKLSRRITDQYDIVAIEDIDMKAMSQCLHFGKSVQDNGYGMFRNMLDYKLSWKGKELVKIDRFFPSSKKCSKCGKIKKELKLSERVYRCTCGNEMDRDRNAAINIREEARRMLTA